MSGAKSNDPALGVEGSPPWLAWGNLAAEDWAHQLNVPGAELLAEANGLDELEPGRYVWFREAVYRTHTNLWLFVRQARCAGVPDEVKLVLGEDPDALVIGIRGQLGMTPGRVEVLGEGGIEIGLEPGDEIED